MSNAQQAIYGLNDAISSIQSSVNVEVNKVSASTQTIQGTVDDIYRNIERFKETLECGEQTQLAHEHIMRIDQVIKEQFSNHIAIRKTVMGVVRDFDINLVRNSTIQELSEELWLTSSRYWLSYALIAITAWVNNYPDLARTALSECCRRDAIKSSLFFCLTNLRFGRMEAAKKWFYAYFRTLDPTMLQQETAVLLQAFLNGIFGKDKELEHEVIDLIDEWVGIINESEQISQELLNAYETYISNLNPEAEFSYAAIAEFCANADELQDSVREVSKFKTLLEFLKTLDVEAEPQYDSNYKARVDAILINLISNYDADELKLRREQEYFRCIVENKGVIDRARSQYDAQVALEDKNFNIGKQMLDWAVYDDNGETDVQVRKFGFQNTKKWFLRAVSNFDARLQENLPGEYELRIDNWTGITNGSDTEDQLQSLRNHFENNKFQNMYINNPNILAAILGGASLALSFATLYALIPAAAAAGFLFYRVRKAQAEYPQRIQNAETNFNNVLSEITEYRRNYEQLRSVKDEVLSLAESL